MTFRTVAVWTLVVAVVLGSLAVAPVAPTDASVAGPSLADNHTDANLTRDLPPVSDAELANQRAAASPLSTSTVSGERTVVIEVAPNASVDRSELARFGVEVTVEHNGLLQATVPAANRSAVAELAWVERVREPHEPTTQAISEGVAAIDADAIHDQGITGSNVSVGVIDLGFNASNAEIEANVVDTKSFTGDLTNGGDSKHGTAVSEIIVDTAPDAELYLANVNTGVELAAAIDWLIEQDVDVISMSLAWRAEPYDGSGFVSQQATSAADAGIVFVNSAGNYANKHWEDRYANPDGDQWVNINGTAEANFLNEAEPFAGSIDVYLSWNDWADPSEDYDLYLYRYHANAADELIDASTRDQANSSVDPYERIAGTIFTEARYYVAIRNHDASGTEQLEVFTSNVDLETKNASSSLAAPAVAYNVTTVAAFQYSTGDIEAFSSHGPTNDGRRGVDVAGPDAVTTTAYNGSFFGTSAAAPHLAGVATLMLAKNPDLTRAEVTSVLASTSLDMEATGADYISGHGRVNASAAVAQAEADVSATDYTVSNTSVTIGTPVEVTATVTNAGGISGNGTASLRVNGTTTESRTVTLSPNETVTETFTHTFDAPGNHTITVDDLAPTTIVVETTPANVSVTGYTPSATTVGVNETVTVDATVENTGGEAGQTNVTLYADGVEADNATVTVEAGATTTATLTTSYASTGTHNLTVGDDDTTLEATTVTVEHVSEAPDPIESDALALSLTAGSVAPGENVTVSFNVTNTANESLDGVSIDITDRPTAWNLTDRADDDGQWSGSDETWLWLTVAAGDSREPSVTFAVPSDAAVGNYTITANASDGSGHLARTSATIDVTNETDQSINEAIAGEDGRIGIADIQGAIQYWANGEAVPGTGGQTIGIAKIQELIQLWAGGGSI